MRDGGNELMTWNDLVAVLPPFILIVGGMVILLADLLVPANRKAVTGWVSFAPFVLALLAVFALWGQTGAAFNSMASLDGYALFLDAIFAGAGITTLAFALRYNESRSIQRGEFYPLLLFAASGMMLMGHATNLLIVFVALELLSIPLYILCGIARRSVQSQESALKYFLLGAFASGFVAYGIALVYGATGTFNLNAMARIIAAGQYTDALVLYAGAGLILAGLGFKVAAVPFHMWAPDVYEGAPTSVTGFMAAATKAAGFAAVARVFVFGMGDLIALWQPVVSVLAALTMIVGNLAALAQTNLKRMLAYSSIAHAGYALVGIAAGGQTGASSVLFYLAGYAATILAAFAVMTVMSAPEGEDQSTDSYTGLIQRRPFLAVTLAIAMLSLTGIPPLAGFAGKYFLFRSAVESGLVWLAVIGALTSVVSAGYYLRVVVVMFMREPGAQKPLLSVTGPARSAAIAVASLLTILIGLLPTPLLDTIAQGVQNMPR